MPMWAESRRSVISESCGSRVSTHGLKLAGIDLNRKVLADIAVSDPKAFAALCDQAKAKLA